MEELETRYTDKGYKISVSYDNSADVEDIDVILGDGVEIRREDNKLKPTYKTKDIHKSVIAIAMGYYHIDEEDATDLEYKRQADELLKQYYIYPIDIYEHGNVIFRLSTGTTYDGVLLLDKHMFIQFEEGQADKYLRDRISPIWNGRIYEIHALKPHIYADEEGNKITMWDEIDSHSYILRDDLDDAYDYYFKEEYGKLDRPFNP